MKKNRITDLDLVSEPEALVAPVDDDKAAPLAGEMIWVSVILDGDLMTPEGRWTLTPGDRILVPICPDVLAKLEDGTITIS